MSNESQWDIRIKAARDAQVRSRFAFLACTIISVALLIAIYNSEFSWLGNFAQDDHSSPVSSEILDMRKEVRRIWAENSRINISLLGINLAESDASLLGSLGLYILTVWFFYCMRRENHLIATLLIDADQNKAEDVCLLAYHGVASYTVFTTIGGDDPISIIRPPPARQHSIAPIRPINIALLFLPAFAIFAMLAADAYSLTTASPLRGPKPLWTYLHFAEWIQIVIADGIGIFLLALTINRCAEIVKFERATESVLRQFHDLLFPRSSSVA